MTPLTYPRVEDTGQGFVEFKIYSTVYLRVEDMKFYLCKTTKDNLSSFLSFMQKFTQAIISRFQAINPNKDGKGVVIHSDIKSEIQIITLEDDHFAMWQEFIENHHSGELINPDTGKMYREKEGFKLNPKFYLNREFFKHFGHFTDADFKVYVQHLLGRTPAWTKPFPKVTVFKTMDVHASHHTGHEWVERRKRKRIIVEEIVDINKDLKMLLSSDGSIDGEQWRNWKKEQRISSGTYNSLLYLPGREYFSKRLTNEGKRKRARDFVEKFPYVLPFFKSFIRLKSDVRDRLAKAKLRTQNGVSLALGSNWRYRSTRSLAFALMDLRNAPVGGDGDSDELTSYIDRLSKKMAEPSFSDPSVWLWICPSEVVSKIAEQVVKQLLPEYDVVPSVYISSKNERLYDAKTRAPPSSVYLLFLLKLEDSRADSVRQNVRPLFTVPNNILYYSEYGRYNESKYRLYSSELRMEFYFEILQLFSTA